MTKMMALILALVILGKYPKFNPSPDITLLSPSSRKPVTYLKKAAQVFSREPILTKSPPAHKNHKISLLSS
jgi:hypothetical protein